MMSFEHHTIRSLRLPHVLFKTGLSRTHLYRMLKRGDFPPAHKLSERVTVWNEAEIDAWLTEKLLIAPAGPLATTTPDP